MVFDIKTLSSHEDPPQVCKQCLSPDYVFAEQDLSLGESLASRGHTAAKKGFVAMGAASCRAGGRAANEMAFQVLYEATHHSGCSPAQTLPLEGTFKKNQESLKQLTRATRSASHHGHGVRGGWAWVGIFCNCDAIGHPLYC